jgi:hypothetical protein
VNKIIVGDWKPALHDCVDIQFRLVKKFRNMFISLLLVILILVPGFDCLTIPLQDHEIGV